MAGVALRGMFRAVRATDPILLHAPVTFSLAFAGSGSVNLEMELPDGTWHVLQTYTSNVVDRLNATPEGQNFRFNCTNAASNIEYRLG